MTKNIRLVLGIGFLTVVVSVLGLFLFTQTTQAQDTFSGQKWEYLELSTEAPSNFSTVIGAGYFLNGEFKVHERPDTTLGNFFTFLGSNGWELVSNVNNQSFIFKRPILQ